MQIKGVTREEEDHAREARDENTHIKSHTLEVDIFETCQRAVLFYETREDLQPSSSFHGSGITATQVDTNMLRARPRIPSALTFVA